MAVVGDIADCVIIVIPICGFSNILVTGIPVGVSPFLGFSVEFLFLLIIVDVIRSSVACVASGASLAVFRDVLLSCGVRTNVEFLVPLFSPVFFLDIRFVLGEKSTGEVVTVATFRFSVGLYVDVGIVLFTGRSDKRGLRVDVVAVVWFCVLLEIVVTVLGVTVVLFTVLIDGCIGVSCTVEMFAGCCLNFQVTTTGIIFFRDGRKVNVKVDTPSSGDDGVVSGCGVDVVLFS